MFGELVRGAVAGMVGAGALIGTHLLINRVGSDAAGKPAILTATALGVTVGAVTGTIHESLRQRGRSSTPPVAVLTIGLASAGATSLHRLLTREALTGGGTWPTELLGHLTYGVATYVSLRVFG